MAITGTTIGMSGLSLCQVITNLRLEHLLIKSTSYKHYIMLMGYWWNPMSCIDSAIWQGTRIVAPAMAVSVRWHDPFMQHVHSMGIDQSHWYVTTRTAMCFEHKTQYLLIRAPYTRIVVFWHISNIPPMISQSQINCNTPTFYIAAIFVKYCYTTGSWLL